MANINCILGNNSDALKKKTAYVAQMIHYSQFVNSKMQFYNFGYEVSSDLADEIELAGCIHQPVVVRRIDAERYEILSGHKRVAASKILVEERGKKEYTFIPAYVIKVDDYMAEYVLISTNDYPDKSDYEKMMEVVRLYDILPHIKPEESANSKILRKAVAKEAGMCETRAGNFKNIYSHFTDNAMEAFRENRFGINVAIKIASLPPEEQDSLVKNEKISLKMIDEYILNRKTKKETIFSHELGTDRQSQNLSSITSEPNLLQPISSENSHWIEKDDLSHNSEDDRLPDRIDEEENILECDDVNCSENERDYLLIACELYKQYSCVAQNGNTEQERIEAQILTEALTLWLENNKNQFH